MIQLILIIIILSHLGLINGWTLALVILDGFVIALKWSIALLKVASE